MLITENLDDLHSHEVRSSPLLIKEDDKRMVRNEHIDKAFVPHVYEIHGNMKYMHCSAESVDCSKKLLLAPSIEDADKQKRGKKKQKLVPKCSECGKLMKPHVLFFDEIHSEHYYRYDTV